MRVEGALVRFLVWRAVGDHAEMMAQRRLAKSNEPVEAHIMARSGKYHEMVSFVLTSSNRVGDFTIAHIFGASDDHNHLIHTRLQSNGLRILS